MPAWAGSKGGIVEIRDYKKLIRQIKAKKKKNKKAVKSQ
jgi:hypothetical protein